MLGLQELLEDAERGSALVMLGAPLSILELQVRPVWAEEQVQEVEPDDGSSPSWMKR